MTKLLPCLLLLPLLTACGDSEPPRTTQPPSNNPPPVDDHHGERHPIGSVSLGGHTFQVVQQGEVTAGKETLLFLETSTPDQPLPVARAWIGIESGAGSMKARLTKEGDHALHAHVEVPDPLPQGAMLWLEIEDGSAKVRNSFAWHR